MWFTSPMTGELKVAIQGHGAQAALAELQSLPGLRVHVEPRDPTLFTRGLMETVVAIVGLASTAVTITDKILAWRDHLKAREETKGLNVVIEDAKGNRLTLDHATPEQVAAVLETLSA